MVEEMKFFLLKYDHSWSVTGFLTVDRGCGLHKMRHVCNISLQMLLLLQT